MLIKKVLHPCACSKKVAEKRLLFDIYLKKILNYFKFSPNSLARNALKIALLN